MTEITLNGETKTLMDEISLRELLEKFELPTERIAVELNKTVVRKKDWTTTVIKNSDKIEIVHFVGGG